MLPVAVIKPAIMIVRAHSGDMGHCWNIFLTEGSVVNQVIESKKDRIVVFFSFLFMYSFIAVSSPLPMGPVGSELPRFVCVYRPVDEGQEC